MNTLSDNVQDSLGLTGDALVDLFEIQVRALDGDVTTICLKNNNTVDFQGKTFEGCALQFSDEKAASDGQTARPQFKIFDPDGVFNTFAFAGFFEGSVVIRRTVLGVLLAADVPHGQVQVWTISMVKEIVSNQYIAFELRSFSDLPNQRVPAEVYSPPRHPYVSL